MYGELEPKCQNVWHLGSKALTMSSTPVPTERAGHCKMCKTSLSFQWSLKMILSNTPWLTLLSGLNITVQSYSLLVAYFTGKKKKNKKKKGSLDLLNNLTLSICVLCQTLISFYRLWAAHIPKLYSCLLQAIVMAAFLDNISLSLNWSSTWGCIGINFASNKNSFSLGKFQQFLIFPSNFYIDLN